ncbi:helix-turn-helix domain-containing protein [Enterococcus sp. ALS3]|uniref:Helix-turn-helix domain-containing protein n=1 Tax=Enterococcus alishanensis TaxID=1303817 RepID=A0ABS6TCY4_9ENTE|nr:helix-turn-helix transcriptional regulator [Enterococcus alishanensis]MBV7390773.1 helix-turn-helix domain-containing protein [Enterococcus alishanensis]
MEIGTRSKQARIEAKFTQEELAEKIQVTRQTISSWENQRSYPDISSIVQLSEIYNISFVNLLITVEWQIMLARGVIIVVLMIPAILVFKKLG